MLILLMKELHESQWVFFRRSRPVFAPSPKCNFGPKGTLKKVQNNNQLMLVAFTDDYKYFILSNK